MADDKSKTGKPDRDRVAVGEDYEVDVLAKKYPKLTRADITKAIRDQGPMRTDIEKELDAKMFYANAKKGS
jgi:hypothetical protein|nr:DUF3606 domain-containing protein [uncultured Dongia sp.]